MRLGRSVALVVFVVGAGGGCGGSEAAPDAAPASADAEPGSPDASDPLVLLTATREEAAGANCTHGGSAVEAGLDADRDGVLDAGEIAETTYVCAATPAVIDDDVAVTDAASLRALDGVTTITGTLTIDAPALATVDVTTLVHAGALDVVQVAAGAALELPALRGVGRALAVPPTAGLGTIAAPAIATAQHDDRRGWLRKILAI